MQYQLGCSFVEQFANGHCCYMARADALLTRWQYFSM